MNSEKAIKKSLEILNLNVFYYFEGEIITRFLYNQSPYTFENFSIKDKSIISKPIYINFDGNYFSLTDEKAEIIYAEYI